MLTFKQLQEEVGAWAKANFEESYTYELPFKWLDEQKNNNPNEADPDVIAGLGSIAPLLGIGEEIGELNEAIMELNEDGIRDAIGDILIYLLDWCSREKLSFPCDYPPCIAQGVDIKALNLVSVAYGKMTHAKLKRCQKIRDMTSDELYREKMQEAILALLHGLSVTAEQLLRTTRLNDPGQYDLLKIANDTWNNVVSKRNWKAWRKAGVENG